MAEKTPSSLSPTDPAGGTRSGGLTLRAVVLGGALGVAVAAGGFFNDFVFGMTPMASGQLPVVLCGVLILGLLTVQPLLRLIRPSWPLRPGEWAVVLAMACIAIPVMAQIGLTVPGLVLPAKRQLTDVAWRKAGVADYLPPGLLVNDGVYDDRITGGFISGRGPGDTGGLLDVPWSAWSGPLGAWMPVMLSVFVASLCLTVIVHQQWSRREYMKFPIAEFISTLIHGRVESTFDVGLARRAERPLFRQSGFWLFFGLAFGIHLCNGLAVWRPGMIQVPLVLRTFSALYNKFPTLGKTGLAWVTYDGYIYLSVVGFSYLLTREISLAVGLTPFVHEIYMAAMLTYGVNPRSPAEISWYEGFFNMGAFLGIGVGIAWMGRSYYLPLLARALDVFGLLRRRLRRVEGVWVARAFLLAALAAVFFLTRVHIAWPFAAALVVILLLTQTVIARINVETGLFVFALLFFGNEAMIGLLGLYATGPRLVLLSAMATIVVVSAHTAQPLMPIVVNALEVCRRQGVSLRKVPVWLTAMIVVAAGVVVLVALTASYESGTASFARSQSLTGTAEWPLNMTAGVARRLAERGQLEASRGLSPFERLGSIAPVEGYASVVFAGFALVLLLNFLRLRFHWWPIHPIVLAIWGVSTMAQFGFSFLIGWMIRTVVTKLFGEHASRRAKAWMIGLIAGELVAIVLWLVVGWLYFLSTGRRPKPYSVLP